MKSSPLGTKNPSSYWIILADAQLGATHWQNPLREEDYYQAFQSQCLKAANDPQCLGILGLGDLRERVNIQPRNLGGLCRGLEILSMANKPLLAIMGNHDFSEPNWIEEMRYPSLKDLTNPKVQEKFGFDPTKTLALNYLPKSKLREALKEREKDAKKIDKIFLHQCLLEFSPMPTANAHETSLVELTEVGFGQENLCHLFLGDIHNYGDCRFKELEAIYPGSLEMTDINEGRNGFKSQIFKKREHDYRKFVLHFFPEINQWNAVEINPRPWFRIKAKTTKKALQEMELFTQCAKTWDKPGLLTATLPKSKSLGNHLLEQISDQKIQLLDYRIQEYDPLVDDELGNNDEESQNSDNPIGWQQPTNISWQDNKKALRDLAVQAGLPLGSLTLLDHILEADGSCHHPKNDVISAWAKWGNTQKETINPNNLNDSLTPNPLNPPNPPNPQSL